jgi:aspartate/methionine/tyrosine aminotransferase
MPRPPDYDPSAVRMPGSPFSAAVLARPPEFALHVGDSWRAPAECARTETFVEAEHPGLHRYASTQGVPELIEAVATKLRHANALEADPENVLITAGATGALSCAIGSLASPGDEILILAPFWPLIRGIVRAFRAAPVEVPFYDRVASAAEAVDAVRARLSPRCVALYVSTPSNPTSRLIPGEWLEALADLARRENLWLLSDEVYEDYAYDGAHVSIGRFAPERTFSAFSKAYAMAGDRIGYLHGPLAGIRHARKIATHTFYTAPTVGQRAALGALQGAATWLAETRASYRAAGLEAARILGVPAPQGGCFLFLPLGSRNVGAFLDACLAEGVALAPGSASGEAYADWVRLCYTALPPDRTGEAVRRVAKQLA